MAKIQKERSIVAALVSGVVFGIIILAFLAASILGLYYFYYYLVISIGMLLLVILITSVISYGLGTDLTKVKRRLWYIVSIIAGGTLAVINSFVYEVLIPYCNAPSLITLLLFLFIYLVEISNPITMYMYRYAKAKGPFILFIILLLVFSLEQLYLSSPPFWCNTAGTGNISLSEPGFFCGIPSYSHTTGNIMVTIGQNTGINWTSWAIMYAPQGTPMTANVPNVIFNAQPGQLVSGQQIAVSSGRGVPVTDPTTGSAIGPVAVGTIMAGSVWVCYATTGSGTMNTSIGGTCTLGANTIYYKQIASVTAKAT